MDNNTRLDRLEAQVAGLQNAYLQSQRNEIPQREQINKLTPQTFTKTAYIDDTSVTFEGIPSGYMTVYCPVNYTTTRDGDRVTVEFDALEEATDITISII